MALRPKGQIREFTGQRGANALQNAGVSALQVAKSQPFIGSVILNDDPDYKARGINQKSGINIYAGETRILAHGLGQPASGCRVAQVRQGTGTTVSLGTLPTSLNASQYVALYNPTGSGLQADIEVY